MTGKKLFFSDATARESLPSRVCVYTRLCLHRYRTSSRGGLPNLQEHHHVQPCYGLNSTHKVVKHVYFAINIITSHRLSRKRSLLPRHATLKSQTGIYHPSVAFLRSMTEGIQAIAKDCIKYKPPLTFNPLPSKGGLLISQPFFSTSPPPITTPRRMQARCSKM